MQRESAIEDIYNKIKTDIEAFVVSKSSIR